MATVEKQTRRLQVQLDSDLLEQAEVILESVGLTQKAALTAFYKQIVRQVYIATEK